MGRALLLVAPLKTPLSPQGMSMGDFSANNNPSVWFVFLTHWSYSLLTCYALGNALRLPPSILTPLRALAFSSAPMVTMLWLGLDLPFKVSGRRSGRSGRSKGRGRAARDNTLPLLGRCGVAAARARR